MKKLLALALLSVAFVGCGNKGAPVCTDKHVVKEILTGVKQGCNGSSGIIKSSSITEGSVLENNEIQGVYKTATISPDLYVISTVRNGTFYSILVFKFDGVIQAFSQKGTQSVVADENDDSYLLTVIYDFLPESLQQPPQKVWFDENENIYLDKNSELPASVKLSEPPLSNINEDNIILIQNVEDLALMPSVE